MAKYSSENSDTVKYFRAFLNEWLEKTGVNKKVAAERLNVAQSQLNEIINGKSGASISILEKMCANIRMNIVDVLNQGRLLCGESPSEKKLTVQQIKAKNAFDFLLTLNDDTAKFYIEQALTLAEKKRAEAEDPFTKQGLKSAS